MISNGCLYHIVRIQDLDYKIPLIELVSVVREFLEVFPLDILDIPHEPEINFCIDLLLDANFISIPHYRLLCPN